MGLLSECVVVSCVPLQDRERLHAAVSDMQTFWSMLDWKRKQMAALATHVLPQSFEHIQFDLRDLMSQVNNEVWTNKIYSDSTPHVIMLRLVG